MLVSGLKVSNTYSPLSNSTAVSRQITQ